ncbi:MAG: DUF6377 domain-containing protein [Muribaculaceae bacterium]
MKYNTDSLILELDNIIENKDKYENIKKEHINQQLRILKNAMTDSVRCEENRKLFFEYRTYKLDSAMFYARKRVEIAKKMNIKDSISSATMNEADGLKGLGKFYEALQLLKSIPRDAYVLRSPYYYHLFHSITLSLYKNAYYDEEAQEYNRQLMCYRDTINSVNGRDGVGYIINKGELLKTEGRYDEALKLMLDFVNKNAKAAMSNATFLCSLSDIYRALSNDDAAKYYLTLGTIQDKIKCVKTYTSFQNLALLLYKEGDTERAYKYITCALEDIMACNARSRLFQVATYMPIISSEYAKQQANDAKNKKTFNIIVVTLVILLLIALAFIYKRNRKLYVTRLALDNKNEELLALNDSLNLLNTQLRDSNKIKEEYIAQLFNICSTYIDKIEKFRLSLSRKMTAGQNAEVIKALNRSQSAENLKEFFKKFDIIFLNLFPDFIDSFNSLIQDDGKILPKEGELLTPELRIYALVRLGINDSTKIAGFLHYSAQTVYNYRLKVRNKSIIPKDEFIERVQRL